VDLRFYPLDALGAVAGRIELATPAEETDRASARSRVEVELMTSYEPLGEFARSLEAIVLGQAGEAVLVAHGT